MSFKRARAKSSPPMAAVIAAIQWMIGGRSSDRPVYSTQTISKEAGLASVQTSISISTYQMPHHAQSEILYDPKPGLCCSILAENLWFLGNIPFIFLFLLSSSLRITVHRGRTGYLRRPGSQNTWIKGAASLASCLELHYIINPVKCRV